MRSMVCALLLLMCVPAAAGASLTYDIADLIRLRSASEGQDQRRWLMAVADADATRISRFANIDRLAARYRLPYRPYGNHCAGDLSCQAVLMVRAVYDRNPPPAPADLESAVEVYRVATAMSRVLADAERNSQGEVFDSNIQRHVIRGQQLRRFSAIASGAGRARSPRDLAIATLIASEIVRADFDAITELSSLTDGQIREMLRDRRSLSHRVAFIALLHGEELPETQLRVLNLLVADGERARSGEHSELIDLLAIDLFGFQWLGTRVNCDSGNPQLIQIAHPQDLGARRIRFGLPPVPVLPTLASEVC